MMYTSILKLDLSCSEALNVYIRELNRSELYWDDLQIIVG